MKLANATRSIVPRSRRPVGWGPAAPLFAFMAFFYGGLLVLDMLDIVQFTRPWWLALGVLFPWFWWMHLAGRNGLRGGRWVVALLVRLCLAGIFIVLFAGPRAVRRNDVLTVVFAVDVSDSVSPEAQNQALRTVLGKAVANHDHRNVPGLVVFSREAAIEVPPMGSFGFDPARNRSPGASWLDEMASRPVINSQLDRDGTNIARALSLSGALVPQENAGRVVLVSDGTATEGRLEAAVEQLKARDIPVDVVSVSDFEGTTGNAGGNEVWLERISLPRHVQAEETYQVKTIVNAQRAGSGMLVLRENGRVVSERRVQYEADKNLFVDNIRLRGPGVYEYTATIVPDGGDRWVQNNTGVGYVYLQGEGRTLIVHDPAGKVEDYQGIAEALAGGRFNVDVITPDEFPGSAMKLMPYDCVLFVNVPVDFFDAMQLQAVHDAVKNLGVGFLMVGGASSFGPGGYHRTPVEEALPVRMDIEQRKRMPKGALVIILHTCEFAQGNTIGKRIAKEAIRVLSPQDEAGVLAYTNGGDEWVFKLAPASNYQDMVARINGAQLGDMPAFGPTMQQGFNALLKSDASAKHMIIISDADPAPPTPSLVKDFKDARISISTIAINPHTPVDMQRMADISRSTGGKFYADPPPSQLPSIFVKEAKTLKRSMVQVRTFNPVLSEWAEAVKGLDGMPPLHAYVLTSLKGGHAKGVLMTPKTGDGEDDNPPDPVLAIWNYGLGKSAAFTSDLSPNWGRDWVRWGGYKQFISQLVTEISRSSSNSKLDLQTYRSGNQGVVSVEDFHPDERFLDMRATVTLPDGTRKTVPMRQTSSRRYAADFPLEGRGLYQVWVDAVGPDGVEHVLNGFSVPYSLEYQRFRASPALLNRIAEQTGGRRLELKRIVEEVDGRQVTRYEPAEEVFLRDDVVRYATNPIFDWFLVALACLLPLDVAARRVQIDWGLIFARLRGKSRGQASTQTMSALLHRKRELKLAHREEDEHAPARRLRRESRGAAPKADTRKTGTAQTPQAPQPDVDPESMSTTERLLAMKKRIEKKE